MTDKEMAKLKMTMGIMLFLFYAMPVAWFQRKIGRGSIISVFSSILYLDIRAVGSC